MGKERKERRSQTTRGGMEGKLPPSLKWRQCHNKSPQKQQVRSKLQAVLVRPGPTKFPRLTRRSLLKQRQAMLLTGWWRDDESHPLQPGGYCFLLDDPKGNGCGCSLCTFTLPMPGPGVPHSIYREEGPPKATGPPLEGQEAHDPTTPICLWGLGTRMG